MAEAIPLQLDPKAHLVEPPIVDFVYLDPTRRAYVVTFVPEDRVSGAETEVVVVPENSSDGRRIALQLGWLASLWNQVAPIERIVHSGGGDFEFQFKGAPSRSLSDLCPSPEATHDAYRFLQDIAMTAEVAFIQVQRAQQPVA